MEPSSQIFKGKVWLCVGIIMHSIKGKYVQIYLVIILFLLIPIYPLLKEIYVVIFIFTSFIGYYIKPVFNKSDVFIFIPIFMAALASVLIGSQEVYRSTISWIILFIFFLFSKDAFKSPLLIKIIIGFSIFASLDSIYQVIIGVDLFGLPLVAGGRATGPFIWPSPVIGNFIMALFFVPLLLVKDTMKRLLVFVIFFAAILASGSRGALLQVLFCIFFVFLSLRGKVFSLVLLGLLIYLIDNYLSSGVGIEAIDRLLKLANLEDTFEYEARASGRLAFWSEYLPAAFDQYWFIGAGLGGLEWYLVNVGAQYIHPHHLYLEIFLSFGIIGSMFLIFYLVSIYLRVNVLGKLILLSFWGPFNSLHSIFDFYWSVVLFFNLLLVYGQLSLNKASQTTNN